MRSSRVQILYLQLVFTIFLYRTPIFDVINGIKRQLYTNFLRSDMTLNKQEGIILLTQGQLQFPITASEKRVVKPPLQ